MKRYEDPLLIRMMNEDFKMKPVFLHPAISAMAGIYLL